MHSSALVCSVASSAAILLGLLLAPRARLCSCPSPAGEGAPPAAPNALRQAFVENLGQWAAAGRFAALGPASTAWAEDRALRLDLRGNEPGRGAVLQLGFAGASGPRPRGEGEMAGPRHFLRAGRAVRGARAFAAVRWPRAWPGIDVVARFANGVLEYDLELTPGADWTRAVVDCAGAERLALAPDGALVLRTAAGELRMPRPRTWTTHGDGRRSEVACAYRLLGADRFGFAVPAWSGADALTIDPALQWSTLVGGTLNENGFAAGVDGNGDVVLAGSTLSSSDFPTTLGAYDRSFNGTWPNPYPVGDGFVAKLRGSDGQVLWATYLGGSENDLLSEAEALANGDVVVSGWTTSSDFPVTPGAFDTTYNGTGQGYVYGGGDVFVTRLRADGAALVWSSFLGGNDLEYPTAMAVAAGGSVTLSGHAHSPDFPTTPGAFSRTIRGASDAYVARFDSSGASLAFSTFFGGNGGEEYGYALGVDAAGTTTIAGGTNSPDLPVTPGAFDTSYNGGPAHLAEGFVARFDARGALAWCTFLGASGSEHVLALALDVAGVITVAGETDSPGFPISAGAYQPGLRGKKDAFVTRLDPTGSALLWSTFLGGSDDDHAEALESDGGGGVVVAGETASSDFPATSGSHDPTHHGQNDGMVAHLDAAGRRLLYAGFLGGIGWDTAFDADLDGSGALALGGTTYSPDFPGQGGAGNGDAWAARLDLLPTGAARFGTATPGCNGLPYAAVTELPRVGAQGFALRCARAPALGAGVCVLGAAALTAPLTVFGAALWIDPSAPLLVLPALADAWGGGELALPIPADPTLAGGTLHAQWLWADPCALSASGGLTVTVQP